MTQQHVSGKPSKGDPRTEAEAKSATGGKDKSSHDAKSHSKAGSNQGAGGGKKQQRQH